MGQLLLVRHGQASWGAEDYDVLSEVGWEQSRTLGASLADRGIRPDVVVHGTMKRHRDTAVGCMAAMEATGVEPGVEIVVDEGWDEFDHVSMLAKLPAPFEGRTPTKAEFQAWFEEATDRWTGGAYDEEYAEPFAVFTQRVEQALARASQLMSSDDGADAGSGTVLLFTSGGPISWAAASLLGGDTALWRRLNPVIVNTGVTKLVAGRRGLSLVTLNEHTHLDLERELLTYR